MSINFKKPNYALANELKKSPAFEQLMEYLRGDNTIPIIFPKQELVDVSSSLVKKTELRQQLLRY